MNSYWPQNQRGSTFLVGIMVLIAVMALGLAGASHSWLEARMTSNYIRGQSLLYYANAALRDGRDKIKNMDLAELAKVQPRFTADGAKEGNGAVRLKKNPNADDVNVCPADGGDDEHQYCVVGLDPTTKQDCSAGYRTYDLANDTNDPRPIRVRWYAIHLYDLYDGDGGNVASTGDYSGQPRMRYFEINSRADRGDGTAGVSLRGVVEVALAANKTDSNAGNK